MNYPEYAIGLTLDTLQPLDWYGIPVPSGHTYVPYSSVKRCGDATLKGYGFPVASWTWKYVSQAQLYNLMSLFDGDDAASVTLYITTYKDVGYDVETGTFECILSRPIDGQGKTLVPGTRSWWSAISVQFAHMVEV